MHGHTSIFNIKMLKRSIRIFLLNWKKSVCKQYKKLFIYVCVNFKYSWALSCYLLKVSSWIVPLQETICIGYTAGSKSLAFHEAIFIQRGQQLFILVRWFLVCSLTFIVVSKTSVEAVYFILGQKSFFLLFFWKQLVLLNVILPQKI